MRANGLDISIVAAADLSSYQFHFVKVDANGRVNICTANTDLPLGILQNKPGAADDVARIRVLGISKIVTAEAIDEGARITSTTTGAGTATVVDQLYCGAIALQSNGTSGDIIPALVVQFATSNS